MKRSQIVLLLVLVTLIACFFAYDLDRYFAFEYLKQAQAELEYYRDTRPLPTAIVFFTTYVVLTGVSLPAAGIMTLAAGALFGLFWGTIIVSFAGSLGATVAFLITRFVFRDYFQRRFAGRLALINREVEQDGPYYLLVLRLVPVFPFFMINAVMALTPIPTTTFYLISQIGMLPATLIIVNAGTELAQIDSPGDILSPRMLASLLLLGVFPFAARRLALYIKARRHIPDQALELPDDKDPAGRV